MKRAICNQCRRPLASCYCHLLQKHFNDCPVIILQDAREAKHALGTARIAELGLQKCEIHVMENCDGNNAAAQTIIDRILACNPVLVYPGAEDPISVHTKIETPPALLFIDATWRRSRKILFEFPRLETLPRISLSNAPATRYRIRCAREEGALATLEAAVYTLQNVEQNGNAYHSLLDVMVWMINDQISHMGESVFNHNYRC